MEGTDAKVVLSFITKDSGGLCVMISGTFPMPRLCAGSRDAARPFQLRVVLILAKAQATSCWTICSARETSLPCGIVDTEDGGDTTATTTKMLVLSVQVLSLFFCIPNTLSINCTQYTHVSIGICRHPPPEITKSLL